MAQTLDSRRNAEPTQVALRYNRHGFVKFRIGAPVRESQGAPPPRNILRQTAVRGTPWQQALWAHNCVTGRSEHGGMQGEARCIGIEVSSNQTEIRWQEWAWLPRSLPSTSLQSIRSVEDTSTTDATVASQVASTMTIRMACQGAACMTFPTVALSHRTRASPLALLIGPGKGT